MGLRRAGVRAATASRVNTSDTAARRRYGWLAFRLHGGQKRCLIPRFSSSAVVLKSAPQTPGAVGQSLLTPHYRSHCREMRPGLFPFMPRSSRLFAAARGWGLVPVYAQRLPLLGARSSEAAGRGVAGLPSRYCRHRDRTGVDGRRRAGTSRLHPDCRAILSSCEWSRGPGRAGRRSGVLAG